MIETQFGNFELVKNDRDAFDLVQFENKYLPEYFNKYVFIVGDLADGILRLKGFSLDSKSPNYFHYIPEYLVESCAYNCKYFILKRLRENREDDKFSEEIIEKVNEENKQEKTVETPQGEQQPEGQEQEKKNFKKKKFFKKRFKHFKKNKGDA